MWGAHWGLSTTCCSEGVGCAVRRPLDDGQAYAYSRLRLFHGDRTPRTRLAAPVLKSIFTWWNSATIGIRFTVARRGVFVGKDDYGNSYYQARDNRDSYDGRLRRWVIYRGYAEASKVPAEWHGWLHHTFDEPPTVEPLRRKAWELDHVPNLTGTLWAWRPKGAISRGG